MIESQQVQEWMAMGEAKGEIAALLEVLATRFPPGAPAELEATIRGSTDRNQVFVWLRSAATADSLEAFQQAAGL